MKLKLPEIRRAVRAQIANALEDDLNGGESIMKEVWEQLDNDHAFVIARAELRRIIEDLRKDTL